MANVISFEIPSFLSMLPSWETMTAYQRALHACRELTKRGQKIPAWTSLREMIGKGSPADIKRAVDDFRLEQAKVMIGGDLGLTQIPLETVKLFREVWALAVQQASDKFDNEKAKLLNEVEIARHASLEAEVSFRIEEAARRSAESSLLQKSQEITALGATLAKTIEQQDHLLARLQQQESELLEFRNSRGADALKLEMKEHELSVFAEKVQNLQKHLERSEKRLDNLMKLKN